MTSHHPGDPTRPTRAGAPLGDDAWSDDDIPIVGTEVILAELMRAEYELLYAVARHRKAWQAMRRFDQAERMKAERQGRTWFKDDDPRWKLKTGDVTWWRGEMEAQATTVTALRAMLAPRQSGLSPRQGI